MWASPASCDADEFLLDAPRSDVEESRWSSWALAFPLCDEDVHVTSFDLLALASDKDNWLASDKDDCLSGSGGGKLPLSSLGDFLDGAHPIA